MLYVMAALDRACLFRWQPAFPGGSRSSSLGPARDPREMEASPAFSLALPALKLHGFPVPGPQNKPKVNMQKRDPASARKPPLVSPASPRALRLPACTPPLPAPGLAGPAPSAWKALPPSPSRGWFLLTAKARQRHSLPPRSPGLPPYSGPWVHWILIISLSPETRGITEPVQVAARWGGRWCGNHWHSLCGQYSGSHLKDWKMGNS